MRTFAFLSVATLVVVTLVSNVFGLLAFHWWLFLPMILLLALGIWDVFQQEHSLFRNYPLVGHFRALEWIRVAQSFHPPVRTSARRISSAGRWTELPRFAA